MILTIFSTKHIIDTIKNKEDWFPKGWIIFFLRINYYFAFAIHMVVITQSSYKSLIDILVLSKSWVNPLCWGRFILDLIHFAKMLLGCELWPFQKWHMRGNCWSPRKVVQLALKQLRWSFIAGMYIVERNIFSYLSCWPRHSTV